MTSPNPYPPATSVGNVIAAARAAVDAVGHYLEHQAEMTPDVAAERRRTAWERVDALRAAIEPYEARIRAAHDPALWQDTEGPDEDGDPVTPMLDTATRADRDIIARATGGGPRSRDVAVQLEDDEPDDLPADGSGACCGGNTCAGHCGTPAEQRAGGQQ